MSDYVILDSEKEIECPYDKSHMVRKKRMQYHLMKCRRNHAVSKDYATCPYNATHEMPKPELRHHMSVCSDRAMVEKTLRYEQAKIMDDGNILKGCTDVPSYDSYNLSSSENWDLEVSSRPRMGVDPSFFHTQTRRSLAGMSPLEKRQFHTSLAPDVKDLMDVEQINEYRPVGMAPVNIKPIKVRLPKAKSQAQTLYQEQKSQQPQQMIQPSQVFQYSLAMAGVGRGGGALQANLQSAPSVGRGVPVCTAPPASIQAYSMKTGNTRQNNDSPPPSIMNFMMKQRLKPAVSNSSNSNENSSNETFSDDDEDVAPGTNGHVTINSSNEIQSPTSETTVMSPKSQGRGVALHQNRAIYNPPIKPASSLTSTGIGRGARLLNGNQYPTVAVPSYTNSWSSLVNGSANREQNQSLPPPDFCASTNINDFPTLNKSDNAKVAQENKEIESVDSKDAANINEILETAKKLSKGLRKKIIGISKLEEKQKKGAKLTPDENIKISKRKDLEDQLASLSVN